MSLTPLKPAAEMRKRERRKSEDITRGENRTKQKRR